MEYFAQIWNLEFSKSAKLNYVEKFGFWLHSQKILLNYDNFDKKAQNKIISIIQPIHEIQFPAKISSFNIRKGVFF